MHPGNYGPGQDPYGQQPQLGQQPQYGEVPQYGEPGFGSQPQYGAPQYPQQPDYGQQYPDQYPGQQYPDQYPPQYPTSASPYQSTGGTYPTSPPPTLDKNWYAVPGYGAPNATNTQALLAMIFGIIALPLTVCCGALSIGFGIAGIVLGVIGMKNANAGAPGKGQALAGVICGGIALLLGILVTIFSVGMSLADL